VEEPQLVEVLLVAVVAAVVVVFLVEGAVEAVEGVSSMMGLRQRLQVYSALLVLLTISSHCALLYRGGVVHAQRGRRNGLPFDKRDGSLL
jgi:hypothetical protein